MKTKSFQKHLEQRLSKEEIAEIRVQAQLEVDFLRSLQANIAKAIDDYMKKNNIGFNETARRLDWGPTKLARVRRGEANLTLVGVAHLFAFLGKAPQEVFKAAKK